LEASSDIHRVENSLRALEARFRLLGARYKTSLAKIAELDNLLEVKKALLFFSCGFLRMLTPIFFTLHRIRD